MLYNKYVFIHYELGTNQVRLFKMYLPAMQLFHLLCRLHVPLAMYKSIQKSILVINNVLYNFMYDVDFV